MRKDRKKIKTAVATRRETDSAKWRVCSGSVKDMKGISCITKPSELHIVMTFLWMAAPFDVGQLLHILELHFKKNCKINRFTTSNKQAYELQKSLEDIRRCLPELKQFPAHIWNSLRGEATVTT